MNLHVNVTPVRLAASEFHTAFCDAILFFLYLLSVVLHDYRIPLSVLCFWHPIKKNPSEQSYYTNILLWLLSKTFCGSISVLAHLSTCSPKQFHKAVPWYRNAHYAQRSCLWAMRNMREKGCFWEPRMNNSPELCAWQNIGAHSMQNLSVIQTFMKDWGCTLCKQPLSSLFFFPDLQLPHVFKSWQKKDFQSPPIYCR